MENLEAENLTTKTEAEQPGYVPEEQLDSPAQPQVSGEYASSENKALVESLAEEAPAEAAQECAQEPTEETTEELSARSQTWDTDLPEAAVHFENPPVRRKGAGKVLLGILAAVLLVALSCGITGAAVYTVQKTRLQQLEQQLQAQDTQLDALQRMLEQQSLSYDQKIAALQQLQNGTVFAPHSGSTASQDAMTPAQLYARCVSSVVAISSQSAIATGEYTTVGTGSGFILSQDGYIVTNHHVVAEAQKLIVALSSGVQYEARLVGSDNINDVALLKIQAEEPLPAVHIGSSSALLVGDQVVAIGNPLGDLTTTATVGYISGKDRPVKTDGIIIDMLQTDAAINSGNSGGPLFNMYGQVVGITTAKYSGTTGSGASIEGIGFAIPIDDVYGMIQDFKDYGYITGGYLGVVVSSMDPDVAKVYNLPVGAYVREVTKGSCAQNSGVQVADIITGLGGYPVENLTDLTRALRNFKAGDQVVIEIYRSGAAITVTAILDEKPRQ